MNGALVAFTGLDGSGKSTVISGVESRLAGSGLGVAVFRNHDADAPMWRSYKSIMASCAQRGTGASYELDRTLQAMELRDACISSLPSLMVENDVVLADRFILDKVLYGRLRGCAPMAEEILATIPFRPDLTLYLDVSVETAMCRIKMKGGPVDWKEEPSMLMAAVRAYHALYRDDPVGITKIDAEQPIDVVIDECLTRILASRPGRQTMVPA